MFFVGIDIGKNNHVASMMDDTGKVVFKAFSFPNTSDGGNALFSKLTSYSLKPSDFEIGMEATGHYWLSVYSFLFEKSFLLHVINPIQTDGWRRGTEIRRRKNDIIDSVLIADLIRYGQFVETRLADEEIKEELILHSDQGSQYTSKAFVEFCESVHVSQSMSKAGCPYDNAPMERYFNTLKNECVNLYEFQTEEALYQAVEEFAYVTYNHVRPHSYNGYRTPYQARTAS